jgi:hypothetical protein
MREMLMRLALDIQERGGAGVVSVEACQDSFCNFLTDDINGPGLKKYDAKYQAQIITDYALSGLGLMIERSPNELGFFHLTIQEYLVPKLCSVKKKKNNSIGLLGFGIFLNGMRLSLHGLAYVEWIKEEQINARLIFKRIGNYSMGKYSIAGS